MLLNIPGTPDEEESEGQEIDEPDPDPVMSM